MALPSSGTITFAQIATELGRTGTTVSLNQSDVASLAGKTTSSSIILPNDFWGKSAADYTPNAVNWANISTTDARFDAINADQTISGISSSIIIKPTLSGISTSGLFFSGYFRVEDIVSLNNVDLWTHSGGATNNTITVPNNSAVRFRVNLESGNSSAVSFSCTVTVVNNSDGNTTLDTFTVTASSPGGGGGPGDP